LAAERSFLDRPAARVLALLVFLACAGALAWLHRAELLRGAAHGGSADDPSVACYAERAAQIDRMLSEGAISATQAELFKSRAGAMCRAETNGQGAGAPTLPTR
jgi:hypothetical protein